MNNTKKGAPDARELLVQAERAAVRKYREKAFTLFEECIGEHLKRQLPFKAIAVSKRARTVLGPIPRVNALIIRTYRAAGFMGDARQELESAAAALRKGELAFLAGLDEEAFLELLSIMELESYPKGRLIMRHLEPGEDVFVLLSGACEVLRDGSRLGIISPGDVFGEIGFFGRTVRSATVKTLEKSALIRIPSIPLRAVQERHLCLREILEGAYSDHILKKVREDIDETALSSTQPEVIATLRFAKGQEIPIHPENSMAVLKHGVVEVDFDQVPLKTKRYLKPGSIISRDRARAQASTDVVILITRVEGDSGKGTEGL